MLLFSSSHFLIEREYWLHTTSIWPNLIVALTSLAVIFQVALKVPVIVRLEGTNVDQGKRILKVNVRFINTNKLSVLRKKW